MNPGDELVDVIDDVGRTIGVATRREMRRRRLPHRSTAVLVFDHAGRLFIHLRTATKDVFPSHWDVAVGGVLAAATIRNPARTAAAPPGPELAAAPAEAEADGGLLCHLRCALDAPPTAQSPSQPKTVRSRA